MGGEPAISRPVVDPQARRALRTVLEVGALVRPVALAGQRLLAVEPALGGVLPEPGLRRGSTLAVTGGSGVISLALALCAAASREGSWVAAVDLPDLGVAAAAQLGVATERLALVPSSGRQWAAVAAALLESVDILVLACPGRVRAADARRLVARTRERGGVLVVLPAAGARSWPEPADVCLTVTGGRWEGLEGGAGYLRARMVEVEGGGRRSASRPHRARLWLPGPDGSVAAAPPPPVVRTSDSAVAVPG